MELFRRFQIQSKCRFLDIDKKNKGIFQIPSFNFLQQNKIIICYPLDTFLLGPKVAKEADD